MGRADREVVLKAVRSNGECLSVAAEALCADCEVVLVALQQNDNAIKFVAKELSMEVLFLRVRDTEDSRTRRDALRCLVLIATLEEDQQVSEALSICASDGNHEICAVAQEAAA